MKVFYVNEKEAKEIEMDNKLDAYYALLKCRCFTIAQRKVGETYYDIYCDDEGLLTEAPRVSAINGKMEPMLVGNLIFTHSTYDGETVGITSKDVKNIAKHTFLAVTNRGTHPVVTMEY